MSGKVVLPKEVAEAIEDLRKDEGYSFSDFMQVKTKEQWSVTTQALPLNYISTETLATALINGYEVVNTPEDDVREYFEMFQTNTKFNVNKQITIRETLNLLGITIEGVND